MFGLVTVTVFDSFVIVSTLQGQIQQLCHCQGSSPLWLEYLVFVEDPALHSWSSCFLSKSFSND